MFCKQTLKITSFSSFSVIKFAHKKKMYLHLQCQININPLNFTDMKLTKAQQNSIDKLNKDLQEWAEYTGEKVATLYEDIWTDFTLAKVAVKGNRLIYWYDGAKETEQVYDWDEVKEWLKFWRACLRRAKKYWATDPDTLDKMSDGEIEDAEIEEED